MLDLYSRFLYKFVDKYITDRLSNNVYFQKFVIKVNIFNETFYKRHFKKFFNKYLK